MLSGLKTMGIYRHVQDPGCTGVIILMLCNLMLYARLNGVVSVGFSPTRIRFAKGLSGFYWVLNDVCSMLVFEQGLDAR